MKLPRLHVLNLIASVVIGIVGSVIIVRTLMAGEGRDPSIWIFVVLVLISFGTALKLAASMYQEHKNRIEMRRQQAAAAKGKTTPGSRGNAPNSHHNFVKERPMPAPLSRDRSGRLPRR
jgi:hypothetical protein